MRIFNQNEYDLRFEWGERGVASLAPVSDVLIVVDVLSFSTCVDIAVGQGAMVFPYRYRDETAADYAKARHAQLASPVRSHTSLSLSPESLMHIPADTRLVLPSPNGSTLSLAAKPAPVLAGCLRNAQAVASRARKIGRRIAVIAAGEHWKDDGSLRPAFEDLVGAGAILNQLDGTLSPEASSARAAFREAQPRLVDDLRHCSSGKELIEIGFGQDVEFAAQLDASRTAPVLSNDAFIDAGD